MASIFKTFTAGSVLTAADLNNYLMKQAVIVCDTSADYPGSPLEGMVVYDKALDAQLSYTGAAWVRTVPVTSTAVQTYEPVWAQGATITRTNNEARYIRTGPIVEAWVNLDATSAGTATNAITVSLPVTASGTVVGTPIGQFVFKRSAVNWVCGVALLNSTTTANFVIQDFAAGFGATTTIASGDDFRMYVRYTV
jgi:hypothetical protein